MRKIFQTRKAIEGKDEGKDNEEERSEKEIIEGERRNETRYLNNKVGDVKMPTLE